jgi:hypothetical protein
LIESKDLVRRTKTGKDKKVAEAVAKKIEARLVLGGMNSNPVSEKRSPEAPKLLTLSCSNVVL